MMHFLNSHTTEKRNLFFPVSVINLFICTCWILLLTSCSTYTKKNQVNHSRWGEIKGVVYDNSEQAKPVPLAIVELSTDSMSAVFQTKSNNNGEFEFRETKPGSYHLSIDARQFREATIRGVRVAPDSITSIIVRLAGLGGSQIDVSDAPLFQWMEILPQPTHKEGK